MKSSSLFLVIGAFILLASCSSIPEGMAPLKVVDAVDPVRYAGRWYEIARYPQAFEDGLVGTTAEYALNEDGTIAVVNSGFERTLNGKYTEVNAVARIPDPTKPSRLKVKFFGLFEADYLIFGLDEERYSWALVGSDTRKFLWFLSRSPEVGEDLYRRMESLAEAQGYKLDTLIKVPQKERAR